MTIACAWFGVALIVLAGCGERSRPASTLVVELGADGAVRVDGRPVDLDGLATQMLARREGGPGRTADGLWCSELDVVLRVAPDACWLHVQLLLAVSAECRLYRTWFERADGRPLRLFQPVDRAIEFLPGHPRTNALCVTIDVEHAADGDARFRCGDRTATNVDAVDAWVKVALERPGNYDIRVAEIRAPARIRFRHVRAVMEALADTDIARTFLYSTVIPTKEVRKGRRLPTPATDWAPRPGRGIRAVAHHPDLGIEDLEPEPPR